MEENRFVEMWNTSKERIFPDWSADIRELKSESASGEKFSVEVILDRMDGKEFFSLFDYEGENIADSLGTIGYELLCLVSKRVPRVSIKNGKITEVINYI